MGCEEVRLLLDAWVDGELSTEQERALMEHVNACEACMREFDAAVMLRDALCDMDDDVVVPLQAQAAWRNAVRAEAKKTSARRWKRYIGAAAAVVVLALGCGTAFRSELFADGTVQEAVPMTVEAAADEGVMMTRASGAALIAADGAAVESAETARENWTAKKKYAAADLEAACETVVQLSAEYSGSCTVRVETAEDGGKVAVCRVELPGEYMQDFLNAAGSIGAELDSQTAEAGETALIRIQIDEEE